ncbi:MAG: FprA family A-type flavoprotein [Oscillospiraceae bacterium]
MQTIRKITDEISYIGANDRRLALFENLFPIENGVSYNTYFIDDEKTAVMDTIDRFVADQFFDNIDYLLQGRSLDYLVIHHMEPDHGANVGRMLQLYPQMKVVCNAKTQQMIGQFFGIDISQRVIIVKEGDTLCLGKHTLHFVMAPMVHWPEVMMSFESRTGILFSADAFGSFGALDGGIFNDEINIDDAWYSEARRYYSNIVGKFGVQVQAVLKKAGSLDIKAIAPLHGVIWRSNIGEFIEKYNLWSSYIPEQKGVLIAYASMYGNTENVANALALELCERGVGNIEVKDVSVTDVSYLISLVFKYSHIVIASATYNLNIYPKMQHFIEDMKALNVQNRTVALIENGSWAPGVIKNATEIFSSMKDITIMEEKVLIKSSLRDNVTLDALADAIAKQVK